METVTIDQALDILQATLSDLSKKRCLLTYAYSNYGIFNSLWKNRMQVGGGDKVERFITLADEGNAGHRGNWSQDTHNVLNTDQTITSNWVTASSNFSYNVVEMSMNKGAARIYDKIENKYNNTLRELVDKIYEQSVKTPNSSSDALNPHGLSCWATYGTDDSTGDWTGAAASYGDANTYNVGGINATTYSRWKNYYADHNGDLDDSLLVLLDRATRKLHFEGPIYPKSPGGKADLTDNYSLYSSDNVIGTLNLLFAKSDDQMGYRVGSHFGDRPVFKGMVFQYVDLLDTADTTRYGTDPIFGVNHNLYYPIVLGGWDFKIGKPRGRDAQHLVITVDFDVVYTYICEDRRRGLFLINQQ